MEVRSVSAAGGRRRLIFVKKWEERERVEEVRKRERKRKKDRVKEGRKVRMYREGVWGREKKERKEGRKREREKEKKGRTIGDLRGRETKIMHIWRCTYGLGSPNSA